MTNQQTHLIPNEADRDDVLVQARIDSVFCTDKQDNCHWYQVFVNLIPISEITICQYNKPQTLWYV